MPDNRVFVRQFDQTDNKETSKVRLTVPLWGKSTGGRWNPWERDSNVENVSIWWRHNGIIRLFYFRYLILSCFIGRCYDWTRPDQRQEHSTFINGKPVLPIAKWCSTTSLQRRHNEHDGVSNHQPYDCLLNRLFRRRSKKTSKLCVTGLCVGNSPGTGEFPTQRASNAEYVSIWWRHHVTHENTCLTPGLCFLMPCQHREPSHLQELH